MASRASKKSRLSKQVGKIFLPAGLGALLAQLANPLLAADEDEALDRAKEIYFQACEAPTAKKRIALAKEAIAVSPLCADAFVLLAENEKRASSARLRLYRKAYDAGLKSLGDSSKNLEGQFWGIIETRPFMRAKFGLAICLWECNDKRESIDHLWEMLRLNPNDNQGARCILSSTYIRTLLIQAAHIILMRPQNWDRFSFGPWLKQGAIRLHKNKLAVALANKLARIAWSVLRYGISFDNRFREAGAI